MRPKAVVGVLALLIPLLPSIAAAATYTRILDEWAGITPAYHVAVIDVDAYVRSVESVRLIVNGTQRSHLDLCCSQGDYDLCEGSTYDEVWYPAGPAFYFFDGDWPGGSWDTVVALQPLVQSLIHEPFEATIVPGGLGAGSCYSDGEFGIATNIVWSDCSSYNNASCRHGPSTNVWFESVVVEINYTVLVPTETSTWGAVRKLYR